MAKTDAENYRQWQVCSSCLDCAKSVDKNWNITISFIIHVNFDHAWAEHYPVTLIVLVLLLDGRDWLLQSGADAEVYVGGVVNLMVKKVNLGIGSQSYRISFKIQHRNNNTA